MANISFPISLWLFLLICPVIAFTSLTEKDFTFADNTNYNIIDKSGALLPHADYRIREDVASLQDEESYHTRPLYSRKLREMKEAGLAPTSSPDVGSWETVFILLMFVIYILVRFALFVAFVVAVIYFLYYVGLLVVICVRYAVDGVKKLWA
ncbi:hypothetical protein RHMOL_Rhmol07G0281500 [Rhododendron molle]|uniref:Uncharacterized protein n=1 Tax=Rhododendron molle TaxID=49168 RepID=A0ACC0N5E2_RHOML|nr:hypothetical protein RHMOL_Rhmol07G0281500 [Rhododendron molle]